MSRDETSTTNESSSISSWQIGFLFTGLAVFAPAYIIIYWWLVENSISLQIYGMLWFLWYIGQVGMWEFSSGFFAIGQSMLFTLLRPLFAIQMVRFYRSSSSKRLTLLIGLITELQPIIVNFQTVLWLTESNLVLRLPIPLTLLIAIIVMQVFPPRKKPEVWIEKEEEKGQSWWSSNQNLELTKIDLIYKILETVLVSEIILLLLGGLFVFNMHPFPLRFLYWVAIPWATLITGILFLIIRYLRKMH